METVLKTIELNKYFHDPEDFHVLKDVSFEIRKGEFVSIVGKSGCGKSTLLYLISTLDTDYAGEIFLNNVKVTDLSQNKLADFRNEHIGFVFQFHFLLPEFTALQNVMIPAQKLGKYSRSECEDRAYEKLKWLDMQNFATKLSSRLSGGQQQRVAIARALINDPTIIMGDEPTGNLDSVNSNIVFDILADLSKTKGQTIIAVTHDSEFAEKCDRIIEMKDGEIVPMKLKQETKIAVIALVVIFSIFTTAKVLIFYEQSFEWQFITSIIGICFLAFFGYLVYAIDIYLDKRLPFEKNVFRRIFLQFILTLAVLFAIRLISAPVILKLLPFKISNEIWVASFAINTFMVLSLILSIFGYHFFRRWKEEKILAVELEKEKAQVQYDNLRNQFNPHFLFNSLTSLNSLIFENPQLASDFLQQLSKVYRYVLDHKEKNLVNIETEIGFVKHYVKLLKTRFEEGLEVSFDVNDPALQKGIVPVTLQIMIENAIKHNGTQKDSPLNIRIWNNREFLIIENTMQKKNVMDISNHQGLANLKNLYRYLSTTDIVVEQSEKLFTVKIPLLEL